jgi:hypothetical protein
MNDEEAAKAHRLGELPDYPRDLTRLLRLGFGLEHVQQISRYTDEVEVWSFLDQPTKPVKL